MKTLKDMSEEDLATFRQMIGEAVQAMLPNDAGFILLVFQLDNFRTEFITDSIPIIAEGIMDRVLKKMTETNTTFPKPQKHEPR